MCLGKNKKNCWVKQGRTSACSLSFKISSSSVQIKFISGDSFNFSFFFGGIFYKLGLKNVFLSVFIKFSTRINNFSTHWQDN